MKCSYERSAYQPQLATWRHPYTLTHTRTPLTGTHHTHITCNRTTRGAGQPTKREEEEEEELNFWRWQPGDRERVSENNKSSRKADELSRTCSPTGCTARTQEGGGAANVQSVGHVSHIKNWMPLKTYVNYVCALCVLVWQGSGRWGCAGSRIACNLQPSQSSQLS